MRVLVPHPSWAIYAMRFPCEMFGEARDVCQRHAEHNCPEGLAFAVRFIPEENSWEWYAPVQPEENEIEQQIELNAEKVEAV